jgi:hypothetical protein
MYDTVKLRDLLLKHLYKGDKIYVGKVDISAAWYGFDENVANWIVNNQK